MLSWWIDRWRSGRLSLLLVIAILVPALPVQAASPDVAIAETVAIHGVVTNADTGLPAPGIRMSAQRFEGDNTIEVETVTDAQGAYSFTLTPGMYTVHALHEHFQVQSRYYLDYDGVHPLRLDFALTPKELALTGRVTDAATGRGIRGACVHVIREDEKYSGFGYTDDNGYYEVWALEGLRGQGWTNAARVGALGYRDEFAFNLDLDAVTPHRDFMVTALAPLIADALEPDDTLNRASPIVPDGPRLERTFYPDGDVDCMKFDAIAGLTYNIRTYDVHGWPSGPRIRLYAGDGNTLLAEGRYYIQQEWDRGHVIEWTAQQTGMVYLRVTNDAFTTGTYPPGDYGVAVVTNPPVAGSDRYETAVVASKRAFPDGADDLIVATGADWPDALGGTALAGVLDAPILLVDGTTVRKSVTDEMKRLGASRIIVLGGERAVSRSVQSQLAKVAGVSSVARIAGRDRYETADRVALRVIAELGDDYDGNAFVATGGNFPDALAAAPLSVAARRPLFLAHPRSGLLAATKRAMSVVDGAIVLGGTNVVGASVQQGLESRLGKGNVKRLAGANRYETAALVAAYGVNDLGLRWNRTGITTGEKFPDALSGGVLQGRADSVMLLTRSSGLDPETGRVLLANKERISSVTYYGGTGALSKTVRRDVETILW